MAGIKLISIGVLVLILGISADAQGFPQRVDVPPSNPVAEKVDEFGQAGDCDLGARIDNFLIQLRANPDAQGYVITYAGKDFLPADLDANPMTRRISRYLARRYHNDHDGPRVTFITGGVRLSLGTELWIVPPGAPPPTPTETIPKPKIPRNTTFLWARSSIWTHDAEGNLREFIRPEVLAREAEEERLAALEEPDTSDPEGDEEDESEETPAVEVAEGDELTSDEDSGSRFDWANGTFGKALRERKNSTGVIIFYADDQYYDVNKIQAFVAEAGALIAADANIAPSRILVLFGGYRDSVEAEYWVVPRDAQIPTATPSERPIPEPF